ncbi:MAG: nucleoside recognition protein [Clostridia bacterium]|nr:nucleoside recognition protein [Clostridia bacterium]MBQ2948155.1 nucleoside recognition protein [Clostridia bacterium]MBQ6859081.1 nucleoside recognition protein [Clostridia bacterium]MBQ7051632.1 nucleoside recognition protein [Clostridia bacterium]
MNRVFCAMLLAGMAAAAVNGDFAGAQAALFSGGGEAVSFCMSMAGAYAFFGGLMQILRESGAAEALSRALERPMRRLFPFQPGEEAALPEICMNLSADMLGMGGAATPAGLAAMKALRKTDDGRPGDAMELFLVMNMCSVQLLPSTAIALRAAAGSDRAADIVLPTLIVTAVSMLTGITLCRFFAGRSKSRG